jgi:hypothetical protein
MGLCYTQGSHAIGYADFDSRSRKVVFRIYDDVGNLIETHNPTAEPTFKAMLEIHPVMKLASQ